MKRFLITFLTVAFICTPIFANTAKVTFVKGKVEVEKNGTWVPLKVGDTVNEKETVSTGFQSEARLNLNGSVLAVAALSRVTLSEMSTGAEKDTVSLYVSAGATRSKVTHAEGKKIDYTSRTSVAVASVRGTNYKQYRNGDTSVVVGNVAVSANQDVAVADAKKAPGFSYFVKAGQQTSFGTNGVPDRPKNTAQRNIEKTMSYCKTEAEKETVAIGGPAKKPAIVNDGKTASVIISININKPATADKQ